MTNKLYTGAVKTISKHYSLGTFQKHILKLYSTKNEFGKYSKIVKLYEILDTVHTVY